MFGLPPPPLPPSLPTPMLPAVRAGLGVLPGVPRLQVPQGGEGKRAVATGVG